MPDQSKEFSFQVYAGPKDYSGLAALGFEQKKLCNSGFFGGFRNHLVGF
jgi:hypothetical protein